MKFLERFTLIIYSYIMILISVVLGLLIFNWIPLEKIVEIVRTLLVGDVSSKILLGISVVFILLSIKCIFFDDKSKQKTKETQGILLKNENGQLMISKESIENIVKNVIEKFENIQNCNIKIDVNAENQLRITLFLTLQENIVIKQLVGELQLKIKEEIRNVSDLEVQEVNVKIMGLQNDKQNKE